MMPQQGKMGYDRAIVTFSPDGRLFQVEYAREAIKRAATCTALKFDGGVILAGLRPCDKLSDDRGSRKVHQIDEHIGAASAGLVGDTRVLVNQARNSAQVYRVSYQEKIDIRSLAEEIGDFKQQHTQYGGLRPMGVSFLVGGVYKGEPIVFETDVGGDIYGWNAQVIGKGREDGEKVLKEKWEEGMTEEQAKELAVEVLREGETDMNKNTVKMAVIREGDGFQYLNEKECEELL
ncbi:MAG: archaeal proteasome endopeptidase complex subunit alpha [Candidatus Aenigmatarchaeota archaeon]